MVHLNSTGFDFFCKFGRRLSVTSHATPLNYFGAFQFRHSASTLSLFVASFGCKRSTDYSLTSATPPVTPVGRGNAVNDDEL